MLKILHNKMFTRKNNSSEQTLRPTSAALTPGGAGSSLARSGQAWAALCCPPPGQVKKRQVRSDRLKAIWQRLGNTGLCGTFGYLQKRSKPPEEHPSTGSEAASGTRSGSESRDRLRPEFHHSRLHVIHKRPNEVS